MPAKANYSMARLERCFVVAGYGHWNQTISHRYVRDFRQQIVPLLNGSWCCLLDIRYWRVSTADSWQSLADNTRWCLANGLVKTFVWHDNDSMVLWNLHKVTTGAVERLQGNIIYSENINNLLQQIADAGFCSLEVLQQYDGFK